MARKNFFKKKETVEKEAAVVVPTTVEKTAEKVVVPEKTVEVKFNPLSSCPEEAGETVKEAPKSTVDKDNPLSS